MNVAELANLQTLEEAKKRAADYAKDHVQYCISYRARAAALSFAQTLNDWDEINAWFDDLARRGAI